MGAVRRGARADATTLTSTTSHHPYDRGVEWSNEPQPPSTSPSARPAPVPVAAASPEASHHVVWTPDEGYVRRVVRAMFVQIVLPAVVIGVVLVGVLVVMLDPSELGVICGSSAFVLVGAFVLVPRLLERRMARQLPAGSRLELALEPEHLFFASPLGAAHLRYELFGRVRAVGRTRRVVRIRQGSTWLFLPRELLPDGALDELARRITAARGR